ncbi:MAG: hypothetical protein ABW073_10120 [Acidimicrobiia bacterium]
MTFDAKNKVAIVGVGHSQLGRHLDRPLGLLALDAALAAIDDAGLAIEDIDGFTTFPELPATGHGGPEDGRTVVTLHWMVSALGSKQVNWWTQMGSGNISTAIGAAIQALATNCCDHVLVWRALHLPRGGTYTQHTGNEARGAAAYAAPYGNSLAPVWFAPNYMRYLKLYGAQREHLATFVVNSRNFANLNPKAFFHDTPMTVDDYMNARMIADPMCLFDCDIPIDGAAAIVLSRAELATSLRQPPAYVTGFGQAGFDASLVPPDEFWHTTESLGRGVWESSGLRPSDVDGAMLYDGFSPDVYFWLEGLGFCGRGEAFEWIQDGRIALGGELPINTFGGNLSEGRLHGIGHWVEATLQIQGRADARQIAGAEHVLVATGLTGHGSGAILSAAPL